MRRVLPFFAIYFFTVCLSAQSTAPTQSICLTGSSSSKIDEVKVAQNGRQNASSDEKKKAIVIPKVSVPITIDGHVNEEAWKTAAVFKDFYRRVRVTTEPSRPTKST